ncbi:hypothetical protein TNCV_4627751 [Trichonephila clavipes]|nr:hypothetical protein TNCV_4627751 [Trichonephila clavipes]
MCLETPGQRSDSAFIIAHPTGPQSGDMSLGAASFDSQTPLVIFRGTLSTQRYIDDILRAVSLRSLYSTLSLFFSKLMTDPTRTNCFELSYSLSNTFLTSKITRSLSNPACLGFDEKATASTRES